MEIYCELKKILDGEIKSMKGGLYLSIKTNKSNGQFVLIPYQDFHNEYLKRKDSTMLVVPEVGIGIATDINPIYSKQGPDLQKVLEFINERIQIDINFEGDQLTVQSDFSIFLELPWENLKEDTIYIVRKVINCINDKPIKENNNLAILMSHAHEGVGSNLKSVMDDEVKSIYKSLHFLIENNQQYFRIDSILLMKHTTMDSIKEIPWKSYNMTHIIMHGDQDGNLCLENNDHKKYKEVEKFSSDEFVNLIKDGNQKIIFLSLCYSGGGIMDKENLAFKIVKAGCSRYVIAYRDPVGEFSAKDFTEIFYKNLTTGKIIEDVYKNSLRSYYSNPKKREYIPLLYSCA